MSDEHAPTVAEPEDVDTIIDRWFRDHIQGSLVARDVDTYNHVLAVVDELKRRLKSRG